MYADDVSNFFKTNRRGVNYNHTLSSTQLVTSSQLAYVFGSPESYKVGKAYILNELYTLKGPAGLNPETGIRLSKEEVVLEIGKRAKDKYFEVLKDYRALQAQLAALDKSKISKDLEDLHEKYAYTTRALYSLLTKSSSGRPVYMELIKDIYPSWNTSTPQDLEVILDLEQEYESLTAQGIKDETTDTDLINVESRLSDAVKEFLSLIRTPGVDSSSSLHPKRFLNPRFTFLATTQIILEHLDLNNLDNWAAQVEQLNKHNVLSDYERAVFEHFNRLVTSALRKNENPHMKLEIISDEYANSRAVFFYDPTMVVANMSLEDLRRTSPQIVVNLGTSSLDTFYAAIVRKGVPIEPHQFNAMYQAAKDLNALKEITNALNSLAEKNYKIALY